MWKNNGKKTPNFMLNINVHIQEARMISSWIFPKGLDIDTL